MSRSKAAPAAKAVKRQAKETAKNERMAAQMTELTEQAVQKAVAETFIRLNTLFAWVLHDEYRFGKKRLIRFQDKISLWCSYLSDKEMGMDFENMAAQLKEETKFDILWQLEHRRYGEDGLPSTSGLPSIKKAPPGGGAGR